MSYLYDELPRRDKASLRTHLEECKACQDQVTRWQTARQRLSQWKLTTAPDEVAVPWAGPALGWGIAALFALGLGFGIGRFSAPTPDLRAFRLAVEEPLRQSLAAQVKQQVQNDLQADWVAAVRGSPQVLTTDFRRDLRAGLEQWTARAAAAATEENQRLLIGLSDAYRAERQQDRQATLTLFDRSERARQAEYVSLRRAVETVAVVADDKFQRTANELGQLASYAQAKFNPSLSDEYFTPSTQNNLQENQ
jgi:hypothetical protein